MVISSRFNSSDVAAVHGCQQPRRRDCFEAVLASSESEFSSFRPPAEPC
jgi:hypothetical protein